VPKAYSSLPAVGTTEVPVLARYKIREFSRVNGGKEDNDQGLVCGWDPHRYLRCGQDNPPNAEHSEHVNIVNSSTASLLNRINGRMYRKERDAPIVDLSKVETLPNTCTKPRNSESPSQVPLTSVLFASLQKLLLC
jgi:hypothetical protein